MSARPASGNSRSTAPATTTTTNRSSPLACPSAPAKMPSTPPAASTSTTQPPGYNPRRTYGRDHLEVPHPIAAGNRLEGRDCQGERLRHRLGDASGGSALDRPVLEGYTIGSG